MWCVDPLMPRRLFLCDNDAYPAGQFFTRRISGIVNKKKRPTLSVRAVISSRHEGEIIRFVFLRLPIFDICRNDDLWGQGGDVCFGHKNSSLPFSPKNCGPKKLFASLCFLLPLAALRVWCTPGRACVCLSCLCVWKQLFRHREQLASFEYEYLGGCCDAC